MALITLLSLLSLSFVALSGLPALGQVSDPTPTTEPATDPPTTTEPAPDTTTTTVPEPDTTTTTVPGTDTTTTTTPASDSTTTSTPPGTTVPLDLSALAALAGKLEPGEPLESPPEFASLTDHQRAMVQTLQTATDSYALRRFALIDLSHQLAGAKDALKDARAAENAAVKREIFGLAEAAPSVGDDTAPAVTVRDTGVRALAAFAVPDDQLGGFHALERRLAADSKNARLARVQAQATVTDLNARVAAQTKAVADALSERKAAESAIKDELGPDAVGTRPDGITATLLAAQAGEPDPIVVGGIALPIPGAALSSPFGLRNDPLSNGAGFHPGIDLAATSGTPIHAAAAGVVVIAGDCGGYGNCVVIDHGVQMATLYAHQSQLLVQVGEHVDAGQVIGLVGSTGASTGPHLHFEVRLHGLPIDPLLALLPS
jgi:murein DD-endopeptidase MepM/ murein hydrolase activator NlpD